MNIGENLARSVSGSVDKAILCVKKPDWNKPMKAVWDQDKKKITGYKFDFGENPTKATSLQTKLANLKAIDKMAKEAASQKGGLFSFGSSVEEAVNKSGYHMLKVKYNPSKIQIDSRAGSFLQPGGEGTNTMSQIILPAQTFMNFEILLDEENHQDAFLFDKVTNLSAGALVSDAAGIVKNVKDDEGYTVRPLVEALIGLLTQSETRQVVFFWSEMAFAGEVVSIDARYTMFNPSGNPIRAVVKITIQQSSEKDIDNTYWDKAFDNLGNGGSGIQGKVNNLLNFR